MQILSWTKINPLSDTVPSQRWGQSSCTILNEFIIFGGFNLGGYLNDLWAFDTLTFKWKEYITVGDVPSARSQTTLNLLPNGRDLILFGGGSKEKIRFNSLHILNWQTKEWKLIEPLGEQEFPQERTYHTANVIGDYLVVFGGQNLDDLDDLWIFDLKKLQWKQVKFNQDQIKHRPIRFHASCVIKNKLFIMGGCYGKYKGSKEIMYMQFSDFLKTGDIENLKWYYYNLVSIQQHHLKRWGHTVSISPINGKVYIFGGKPTDKDQDFKELVELDLELRLMKPIRVKKQLKREHRRHSASFFGNSLVVFGGYDGQYLNDIKTINIITEKVPQKTQYEKNRDIALRHKYEDLQMNSSIEKIEISTNNGCEVDEKEDYQALIELIQDNFLLEKEQKMGEIRINEYSIIQQQNFKKILSSSSEVSGIIILSKKSFQKYIKQNLVFHKIEQCNPEINQLCKDQKSQVIKEKSEYGYSQMGVVLQLNGKSVIYLDQKVKEMSEYFLNAIQLDGRIRINVDEKYLSLVHACFLYLDSYQLVIPDTFTLKQWSMLWQMADYICYQQLCCKIDEYLSEQVTFNHINSFIPFIQAYNLPQLSQKCPQLIVNHHFDKFVVQNINIEESQITDKFNKFQAELLVELFEHSNYSKKFAEYLMKYFQTNHFGLLVKFITLVRDTKKTK